MHWIWGVRIPIAAISKHSIEITSMYMGYPCKQHHKPITTVHIADTQLDSLLMEGFQNYSGLCRLEVQCFMEEDPEDLVGAAF